VVKSVRTWNASDEVNELIAAEAPKGRGFSAWANKKLLAGHLAEKNKVEVKSSVTNLGVEL